MDDSTLNLVNAIGAVFSAIGTVAAVVLALYLARRDNMIRLLNSVTEGELISQTGFRSVIMINITNIGRRPVQVNSLSWRLGFIKKRFYFIKLDQNDLDNHPLPKKLEDGDQAQYFISFQDFKKIMGDIIPGLTWIRRNHVSISMKLLVHTSAGKTFIVKPDKILRTQIGKLASIAKTQTEEKEAA